MAGIAALLLAACDRPGSAVPFHSIDVSGADWGRFKVFYRKVPTGSSYTMDHTATSFVFDPAGRLHLGVRHEQDAASVTADISRLLKENP
ncbi:hypothetical protein ABXN37_16750 [Piscinibacter sakaiensis]|uniref:Cytochrome oxidase biogenesis protein Sco1/SenC/PrrC n=1 Tax=Piscinibacter sakaiensis TaxID=1547922 RepID=A0A0K8P2D6_PISS1|nr:cytochrome oxidase biogenesis protein Sco1/SenC/PrrC [Piscinibacter sakaiensis]